MSVWDLSTLTPQQREITQAAISRCSFPWEVVQPALAAKSGGRSTIPVEWTDLSRYTTDAAVAVRAGGAHDHDHGPTLSPPGEAPELPEHGHLHVVDTNGDVGHGIAYRQRVLGLAWYSGRVSIDASLVHDPLLAQEVFLAEGAHMVDFFGMSDSQREAILHAYHGGKPPEAVGHPEDWFEAGGENDYADWVGESFMIGFTRAYSDLEVRFDQFSHASTPEVVTTIKAQLTPTPAAPEPPAQPEPPVPPEAPPAPPPIEPTPDPATRPFGFLRSKVYHVQEHGLVRRRIAKADWGTELAAKAALRRLCRVCERRRA